MCPIASCIASDKPLHSTQNRAAAGARLLAAVTFLACLMLAGCGGSSSPGFVVDTAPSTVAITAGGSPQAISIAVVPVNGFTGSVVIAPGTLPAGITITPASMTLAAGSAGQFMLSADRSAVSSTVSVAWSATSGTVSQLTTSSLSIVPPVPVATTASVSNTSFEFGDNLVGNPVVSSVVAVTNTGIGTLPINPTITGDASFTLPSTGNCPASLAAGATCAVSVRYSPTAASAPNAQTATLNLGFGNLSATAPETVALSGVSAALQSGVVIATNNPQVALYTITLPFPGTVSVSFGPTAAYEHTTWTQSTSAAGPVSIFVAGLLAQSTYHMAANVQFANGITATDSDHTFTTGAIPAGAVVPITGTTTPGMTPQPGLELVNTLSAVLVTDLSGKTLWSYVNPGELTQNYINGAKMLPNGDILMVIGPSNTVPLSGPPPSNAVNEIREVNLGGDTVREISIADLNVELANATCAECNVRLGVFSHEVTPLPNGHWLVLANTTMNLSPTTQPPLTNGPPQSVLGDVIVDLDQNLKPVWAWNEFNHLDPNRQPMGFSDWTHTNAVLYSPDDGNIVVSIRHQNWVVKVNYANGTGNGAILWRLGEGGDFTLVGGSDPADWQYAQHGPGFFSPNTSGLFSLGMFDNGDDRQFPTNETCGQGSAPPCLYSTVPIFQIDESAMTATLTSHTFLSSLVPNDYYSGWGGNAQLLANGDTEFDACGTALSSYVFELTRGANPQVVWELKSNTANLYSQFYRAFRIPSLYPGVQW